MSKDELPPGWGWTTVDEVIEYSQYGSSAKTDEDSAGVPVLRMGNIQEGKLRLTELKYLPKAHPDFPTLLLQAGDLLFNRTNSAELVGKSAVYDGVPTPCSYASYLVALRFGLACQSQFVCFYLNSQHGKAWIRSVVSQQVGQANVNSTKLRALRFPLAPLAEQRRIVARIEELFAELDAAVEELQRVRANLKRYRAAVLKAAVTGDLTADWRTAHPNAEPASVLLDRILTDRRAKWEADQLAKFAADKKTPPKNWQAKYAEPSKPDTSKLPGLPAGWCWVNLDQLLEGIESGKSFKCQTRKANPDEWAVIKVSAMTWGTFLEEEQKALQPNAPFDPNDEVRTGDLLLSRCNTTELVGATVLVGVCRPKLLLSDKSLRLLLVPGIDRSWLHKALSSSVIRGQLSAMATGTSDSMRNVSQEKIVSVVVPLPPLAEQEAIVLEMEARLSDVTAAEAAVNANLTRAARLRQSILKEAFAGRLVPQDPADEPAAVLLERLRTAKPAATPAKTPRGRKKAEAKPSSS